MGGLLSKLHAYRMRYEEMLAGNRDAAEARNARVLRVTLISGVIIFACVLLASLFVPLYSYLTGPYIIALALVLGLLAALRFIKRLPVITLVYITNALIIIYACVTSAFVSPQYVCVTILALLLQFPILYLDKGWRVCLAPLIGTVVYLAVIWNFKDGDLLVDEVVNCCCFMLLGTIIGAFTRWAQLENFEMRRELSRIAYRDQLTGLYNRRKFFERLAACERPDCAEPVTALIMLDLDEFKRFNDTYGHQAGDDCLRAVGQCLLQYEERCGITFYRYGGEEFVGASSRHTREELAADCEALVKSVAAIRLENAGGITVSAGAATFDEQMNGKYTALLAAADLALYAAKGAGRNQAVIYSEQLRASGAEDAPPPSFRQR